LITGDGRDMGLQTNGKIVRGRLKGRRKEDFDEAMNRVIH